MEITDLRSVSVNSHMIHMSNYVTTSALSRDYVIIGICPSVCLFVYLLVNSVSQKLIDGFSSNFHRLSLFTEVRTD